MLILPRIGPSRERVQRRDLGAGVEQGVLLKLQSRYMSMHVVPYVGRLI